MTPEFTIQIAPIAGGIHALACAMNLGAAIWAERRRWVHLGWMVGFAILAWFAFRGQPVGMPTAAREIISVILGPATLTLGSMASLIVFYRWREQLVKPIVAWTMLNAALLFLGLSLVEPAFATIVSKPDNVPIVGMVFALGFFVWLGASQGVENDRRLAAGCQPVESDYSDSVFVWPDLIYLELIGFILGMVVLIVWSLAIRAPLEAPANPMMTPNPAKAPWYFVGLQEMLVYFAPWMAGVTLPLLIIFGLMALPYLDVNPRGNGYYSVTQRRGVWLVYHFGFLMWIVLILIGVFFRGPNWSFFGIYELHDLHKMTVAPNQTLAEWCWISLLHTSAPQWGGIWVREMFGLLLLGCYYVVLPIVLGHTWLRKCRMEMGAGRFWIMILLLLIMVSLPVKMLFHWTFHLSYIVCMPEYFFYY